MEKKTAMSDESEEERARTEMKTESQNAATSMREQWLVMQRMAVSKNDHILSFGEVFKTSLTSWNPFNVRFAITLLHMADCPQKYVCHAY